MVFAKRQRTGVKTSGKTNSPPGQLNLHRAGSGGGGKNTEKEERRLSLWLLFESFPLLAKYN